MEEKAAALLHAGLGANRALELPALLDKLDEGPVHLLLQALKEP